MTSKKRKLAYIREKNSLRQRKSCETFKFKISMELSEDEEVIEQLIIDFANKLKRKWNLNFTLFYMEKALFDNDFIMGTETCLIRFKVQKFNN